MNIRSIRNTNKINEIETIIQTNTYPIHVIILSETWLEEHEIQYFNIPSYEHYASTRPTHAGGVSIFIHNSITSNCIYNSNEDNNNILGIEVFITHTIKRKFFGIYKQPKSDKDTFINHLHKIFDAHKNAYYFGDFNINILDNQNNHVNTYMDTIYITGNVILNNIEKNHYTRPTTNTIIDHVITDQITDKYNIYLQDTHISDHRYIYTTINFDNHTQHHQHSNLNTPIQVVEYSKIKRSDINKIIQSNTLNSFINNIQLTIRENTANKTQRNHERKQIFIKPWISKTTIDLIKTRNIYYKLKIKFPNNTYYRDKFVFFRNKINFLMKTEKQTYFELKFENNLNDSKQFWKTTNEIIYNKKHSKPKQNITLTFNNTQTNDETEVANIFNKFFVTACNTTQNTTIFQAIPIQYQTSSNLHLFPTSSKEVQSVIKNLKQNAANGHDNISIKFFQFFSGELSSWICKHINGSFKNGHYPDELKIGKITPVYKAGTKSDASNYRPISVLPSYGKIFDKIIQHRFEKFLQENNVIHKNQFGFVTNSSTIAACTQLMNFVETNIDHRNVVACLFIDLQKAYDSVDLNKLFGKLERIGIKGTALKLFKSYHTNRFQYVEINKKKSQLQKVTTGVVQGSMLSAPEFSIFINEIFYLKLHGEIQMYADDAILMFKCPDEQTLLTQLQNDIITINEWLETNHLKMNLSKTHYMIFDKNKEYTTSNLKINNMEIQRVYDAKYLGLLIDSKLTWSKHIGKIKNKIRSITFAIRRLRDFLHPRALTNIYNAHVLTHLNYLNPIWSGCNEILMNELRIVQNKTLKTMYKHPPLFSTELLYTLHPEVLPLLILNKIQITQLIFKIKFNYIKHNFHITYRYDQHNHPTRYNNHINVPFPHTNLGLNTILYRGVKIFNELPNEIKNNNKISQFKNKLKLYYQTQEI